MKTWLITGANRGLGLEIARAALAAGDRVVATARQPAQLPGLLGGDGATLAALPLDVTDKAAIARVVETAIARFGGIDVLVNNAGYGQLGAFEEVPGERVEQQFATNVFGLFDITRAVLPHMRAERRGHIINISSISGIEGYAGSSLYAATKHAVSGWSEALAAELAPFGIKVTCIYPGRFRTDFLDLSSVRYGEIDIEDYRMQSAERRRELDAGNHRQIGDPKRFATAVLALVAMDAPPVWFAAGSDGYQVFTRKGSALLRNAEDYRELTLSTDIAE